MRIMNAVEEHDEYFVQKRNAAGTLGLSSLQKVVVAFRLLAYGVAADALDEYIYIGESTVLEALKKFTVAVVEIFGQEYGGGIPELYKVLHRISIYSRQEKNLSFLL